MPGTGAGEGNEWSRVFEALILTLSACTCALLLRAARTRRPLSPEQEHRLTPLRWSRVLTFLVLAMMQMGDVGFSIAHRHAAPWNTGQIGELAMLCTWMFHEAILCSLWPGMASLQLLPSSLLSLCLGITALVMDCLDALDDGRMGYDVERVVSIVVHALALLLLLTHVVAELVVAQHVEILRSGDGESFLAPATEEKEKEKKQKLKAENAPKKTTRWNMVLSSFKYVLPQTQPLKLRLAGCFLLVALERCVNLAVPLLYKHMVDTLSKISALHHLTASLGSLMPGASTAVPAGQPHLAFGGDAPDAQGGPLGGLQGSVGLGAEGGINSAAGGTHVLGVLQGLLQGPQFTFWNVFHPWVLAYLAAFFLRGGSGMEGLLASIRDILWAPITQAAFRRVSIDVFGHLLDLDHAFHVKRKTGQIMRILDRGTTSIQDTVEIVMFNVLPQLVDIVAACTYLAAAMQPWAAVIVAVTVTSYVPITVIITERRGAVRKRMNALDNAREARATDMLLNYETVKLFCAESLEVNQYDAATRQYQAAEYWQLAFLALLAIVQGAVVWVGMSAGVIICVKGVVDGSLTVGDAVLFITVVNQLYVPLSVFGSYYRQVQKALVDVENMFDLLATEPKVRDRPGAKPLAVVSGAVDFRDVVFGYHPAAVPVLRGVSFGIQGGRTLAVVGATGSGKSTILKLLLRFYDPLSGSVNIDNQDIKDATLASVRKTISVVPQDAVLFNQSVAYNIRYGAPDATDEEVSQAAAIAHIHSAIVNSFKKGYDTRVGERGVRLSGGEKQRVAFARAVVKKPSILILDEATSALDSITEQQIQSSLRAIRSRVTTIIVAHRLSTIMDADTILVLDHGLVAQCGSHNELLESGGLYASMWARQLSTEAEGPETNGRAPPALGCTNSMAGSGSDSEDEKHRNFDPQQGGGDEGLEGTYAPPRPVDVGVSLRGSRDFHGAEGGTSSSRRCPGYTQLEEGEGRSEHGVVGANAGSGQTRPSLNGWQTRHSGDGGHSPLPPHWRHHRHQQHLALLVHEHSNDMGRSGEVSQERTPDWSRHPTPQKRLPPRRDASCSDGDDEPVEEPEEEANSQQQALQAQSTEDSAILANSAAAALLSSSSPTRSRHSLEHSQPHVSLLPPGAEGRGRQHHYSSPPHLQHHKR
mmetsp:Transcript_18402/g.51583  ORF Transcript_18402/g.51583 Transcript_18402/m.51583 type:complete len:1155 (+) Transcript_18402:140-3604(+)